MTTKLTIADWLQVLEGMIPAYVSLGVPAVELYTIAAQVIQDHDDIDPDVKVQVLAALDNRRMESLL